MALNISITTSMESEIVLAVRVVRALGAKMLQSTVAKERLSVLHWWNVRSWVKLICGPWVYIVKYQMYPNTVAHPTYVPITM